MTVMIDDIISSHSLKSLPMLKSEVKELKEYNFDALNGNWHQCYLMIKCIITMLQENIQIQAFSRISRYRYCTWVFGKELKGFY